MTPAFASAVDPVFLHVLGLWSRINAGEAVDAAAERLRLVGLIDQADARLGTGQSWQLAKYALVSWVDELLVDTPWPGQDWWSNNVLEVELFNSRVCSEQFYLKAREAAALTDRNALEVYYICVVLLFRGMYRDPEAARSLLEAHGLPPTLEGWAKQVAMSIRLGQGRRALPDARRRPLGAAPLIPKSRVLGGWFVTLTLICGCALYYFYVIR